MHVHAFSTLQTYGSMQGDGLEGTFRTVQAPAGDRYDQHLGAAHQETLHLADGRSWIADANDNVRELRGLLAQRERTSEFIDGERFTTQPQYDTLTGSVTLPDGRAVYVLNVEPPGGLSEEIDLDSKTFMIDRLAYDEGDSRSSETFYDYHVYSGALVPLRAVDSDGDARFDVWRSVARVIVDSVIDPQTFAVPKNNEISAAAPVTVQLEEHGGHYFAPVTIGGKRYRFLVDTGAQAIVIDTRVARELGLHYAGRLEVSGAKRIGGLGIATLDSLHVGDATLPLHVAAVLDLHDITGQFDADGVLGYPFFASAEVQFDAASEKMIVGRPGTLPMAGPPIALDVDREMLEVPGRVNGVDGRFVIDTGNSGELLLFAPFMQAHPNLLPTASQQFAENYGVGGSIPALSAIIDELDVSTFRFYNRYSNVMLAKQGAFADKFAAGNIGMGVLQNLIVTFDVANGRMYASQSRRFDDGRLRPRTEHVIN